jgi:hypothetical protein
MPNVRAAVTAVPLRTPRRVPHTPPALRVGVRPGGDQRRLSDTGVGACLLRRLDAAVAHPSDHAMAALRAAVTDLVDRMKALGLSLDHIVAAVELLLREHGIPCPGPTLHTGDALPATAPAAIVRARLFDWCSGAYRDDAWW